MPGTIQPDLMLKVMDDWDMSAFGMSFFSPFFVHFHLLGYGKFLTAGCADVIGKKGSYIIFFFKMWVVAGFIAPFCLYPLCFKIFHTNLITLYINNVINA
jgi:hypothetical protein